MEEQKTQSYRIPRIIFFGTLWMGIAWLLAYSINIWQSIPSVDKIEAPESFRSSRLYAADLELLAHLHRGENRESISLEDVSPHFIAALIATEDKRFQDHAGIDPQAFPSIGWDYLRGKEVRGGSTISMQLARNLFSEIGRKRSVKRKLREIATAIRLEKTYTKEEILELYLNTVNIYGNCYGVETAAKRLFGKSATDLNWEEAALMVGLLKGQGTYHPRRREKLAFQRRNTVLNLLEEQEKIDKKTVDSLKQIPIQLIKPGDKEDDRLAPYFVERARLWLENWGKQNGYDIYRDGLEVHTTIDTRVQRHAEEAVRSYLKKLQKVFDKHIKGKEPWREDPDILDRLMRQTYRYLSARRAGMEEVEIKHLFDSPVPMKLFTWEGEVDTVMSPMDSIKYYSRFLEAGMAVVSPSTGNVLAWVGGVDYDHFRYDHVELGKRQTGSTFKPFVYAAAIDNGFRPCDRLLNQRVTFDHGDEEKEWTPKNVGNNLGGKVTLQQALKYSYNVVTARLTKDVTPERIAEYAQAMGIQTEVPAFPSIGLGTTELNVLEMTGAYGTFVNQGEHIPPVFIAEIRDNMGNVIYEADRPQRQALPRHTAYTMTQMLQHAGGNCGLKGELKSVQKHKIAVGGKTGTTQDHSDGWFVGITPELAAGVWVGCAERKMRFRTMTYGQGAYMARPIFGDFMERAYRDESLNLLRPTFFKPVGYEVNFDCWKESIQYRSKNPETKELPTDLDGWEG
jgi:penicillin-binding protein 1A